MICKEKGEFSTFPQCPSDKELRAGLERSGARFREEPGNGRAEGDLQVIPHRGQALFTLLRLKGMEIYFGRERASILAKRLGLRRLPGDEEIRPGAFLYAVALIEGACEL